MYDLLGTCSIAIITLLGFVLFVFPKQLIKKELRESPKVVAKYRFGGLVMGILGAIILIATYMGKGSLI